MRLFPTVQYHHTERNMYKVLVRSKETLYTVLSQNGGISVKNKIKESYVVLPI